MVPTRVYGEYINFVLIYTTDNIFTVITIKHLVYQDSEPTTPQKLPTGTKQSLSDIHVLFFSCVVQKATAHFDKNKLNMYHQSQKGFVVSSSIFHNIRKGNSPT